MTSCELAVDNFSIGDTPALFITVAVTTDDSMTELSIVPLVGKLSENLNSEWIEFTFVR